MEWYPKVLQLVNTAFPTLRKTRKRNLTLLTHAILKRRHPLPGRAGARLPRQDHPPPQEEALYQ